jgi:hypothetical protein
LQGPTDAAIELLRRKELPSDWKWVLCTKKAAFQGGDPTKGPGELINGKMQYPPDKTGTNAAPITTEQALERWSEESWRVNKKGEHFQVRKTGVGVATGDPSNGLVAVDLDGPMAEKLLKEKLGDQYPDLENPGTMSWTGRPGRRQLLYQIPDQYRASFVEFTSEQIFTELKSTDEEANIRYNKKYSVIPGSYHPDTKKLYQWITYNDGVVAEAPGWLIEFMLKHATNSPLDPSFIPESYLEKTAKTEFSGKQLRGIFWGQKGGDGGLCRLLTSNDAHFKQFFDTPVWEDDYQPLVEEQDSNGFKGGCPFHDSNSGTSFFLNKNNLGFYCHKEKVGGDGIRFLHAFKTGDIEAGDPSPVQLEYYIQQISQIVGKKYPEAFRETQVTRVETKYDTELPLLQQIREISEKFENPAEEEIELLILADNYGIRRSPADLRFLLAKDEAYKASGRAMTARELCASTADPEFIIPEIIQKPQTAIIHGDANSGKTALCAALATVIVRGAPFKVRDQMMPVEQGKVLWFTGDCNDTEMKMVLLDADLSESEDFIAIPDFKLSHKARFQREVNKHKPHLVIIDSLSSASDAGVDENKKEAAEPLYWLNTKNGVLWPACAIIIIHHDNKDGGYRGSTAIRAAVSEMWHVAEIPEDKREHLPNYLNQRLVTNGKSRNGMKGRKLLSTLNDDYTVDLQDWRPEGFVDEGGRMSVQDKVLKAVRDSSEPITRGQIEVMTDRPLKDAAVRKSLQRLVMKKLILCAEDETWTGVGSKQMLYWANEASKTPSREKSTNNLSHSGRTLGITEDQGVDKGWTRGWTNADSTPDLPPDIPEGIETAEVYLSQVGQPIPENDLSHLETLASTDESLKWDSGTEDREAFRLEDEVRPPMDWDEIL